LANSAELVISTARAGSEAAVSIESNAPQMASILYLETKKRLTSISLIILSVVSKTISVLALKNGTKKTVQPIMLC
jgi:hypothetical protein